MRGSRRLEPILSVATMRRIWTCCAVVRTPLLARCQCWLVAGRGAGISNEASCAVIRIVRLCVARGSWKDDICPGLSVESWPLRFTTYTLFSAVKSAFQCSRIIERHHGCKSYYTVVLYCISANTPLCYAPPTTHQPASASAQRTQDHLHHGRRRRRSPSHASAPETPASQPAGHRHQGAPTSPLSTRTVVFDSFPPTIHILGLCLCS